MRRFPDVRGIFLALALAFGLAPSGAAAVASPDSASRAAAPAPPRGLAFADVPNDAGHALSFTWHRSPDDVPGGALVGGYRLERATEPAGPWLAVDSVAAGDTTIVDAHVPREQPFFYRVVATGPGGETPAGAAAGPAVALPSWFDTRRASVFVWTLVFFALVIVFTERAQSGRPVRLRRLPAIDAIEGAIARAARERRPVLFVSGVRDIDDMQTVASLMILDRVAALAAKHGASLRVPVAFPIPFTMAQERVRGAAVAAGAEPDPDAVTFVSPEQFAYVAAVTGIVLRDRPAAHLFLGSFYGESLLLAETGAATGATQIGGTGNVAQLPFFVTACDHALLGEELFAASAYLSGEPKLVGSLKAADLMKGVVILFVLAGALLETFGRHGLTRWMHGG